MQTLCDLQGRHILSHFRERPNKHVNFGFFMIQWIRLRSILAVPIKE